jgi:hypothetical protein
MEMKQDILTTVLIIVSLACWGCLSRREMERSWESIYRDILHPNYRDFRAEVDDTEDGYVIFSYSLPENVAAPESMLQLRQHIVRTYPCYQAVTEMIYELVLRCPGGRTGLAGGQRATGTRNSDSESILQFVGFMCLRLIL